MAINPNYPNIFNPGNCSLISQLLPPGPKKFLFDFMAGNAFRNPIAQAIGVLGDKVGGAQDAIAGINDALQEPNEALNELNTALFAVNNELQAFQRHTDRLSGIGSEDGKANLDQILGVMSSYNTIKDLLKDPGELLQDNFSNAFRSLNPQIVGPFFENFGKNMGEISRVLGEIQRQTGAVGGIAQFAGQLATLSNNIVNMTNTIKNFREYDDQAFALALAFVERYALGNSLISSALTDPCFAAKLLKNGILNPNLSNSMNDIAKEYGVEITDAPFDILDFVPSLKT
jgi:hypothetical protein